MAERRRRRRDHWGRFLLIWAIILLLLGAAGCFALYRYLGIYEITRPEIVMDEFIAQADANTLLQEALADVRLDVTEFEDQQALYAAYLEAIDTSLPLTYRPDLASSGELQHVYIVRSGTQNLCSVVLRPDGSSPGFGRYFWKVQEVYSAPITRTLPSVTVTVDAIAGEQVLLNGKPLTDHYITEQNIAISNLSPYEAQRSVIPHFVRYTVGPLYSEVRVTGPDGRDLPPEETDGSTIHYAASTGEGSYSIFAPEDVQVRVNEIWVDPEAAAERSPGVLNGLDIYLGGQGYQTLTWTIDGLYLEPEVKAHLDTAELTPLRTSDGSVYFFHPNDPALQERFTPLAEDFFTAYIRYTSAHYDDTLFWNLISKVLPGTYLHNYLSTTRDTMLWAGNSTDDRTLTFDNFSAVGDNCFVCTVAFDVDRTSQYWNEQVSMNQSGIYELAFVNEAGTWYAAGMNLISAE